MKIERLTQERAAEIIVYGENQGFSYTKLCGENATIHHRNYEGEHYDIIEMELYIESQDEYVTVFYKADPKEILQILGLEEDYFEKDKSKSV